MVTFALDGAPKVVRDGVSGYLVPPLDTDRLADRVVELLRDPERRSRFGAAGRAFAIDNFGVELIVRRIDDVYQRLLTTKTGRGGRPRSRGRARGADRLGPKLLTQVVTFLFVRVRP